MQMREIMTVLESVQGAAKVPLADEAKGEILRAFSTDDYIIAYMTPDQYTSLARMRADPAPLPNNLGGNMDRLRADIEQHGLRQLPWIVIEDGRVTEQEGLHRAAVLNDMGFRSIPVKIFARQDGEPLDYSSGQQAWRSLL